MNDAFKNSKGEKKEQARVKMIEAIKNSGVTGLIPTLPWKECKIESVLATLTPDNKFIGCEIDKKVYNAMRKTIREQKLPIEAYHGMISDKIYGVSKDTYAHLILDYCGTLPTFAKEIEYAVNQNIIKLGGTISITICKRGHSSKDNIVKRLSNIVTNNDHDGRGEVEKGIEAYFHKVAGWDYVVEEIFYYQDRSPMVLIQMKRIR